MFKGDKMLITEDTIIANSEEVSAALELLADKIDDELWGEEYAAELRSITDEMDRLVAALRILKKERDAGNPA